MLLKIQVSELMFRKQDERMKTGQKVEKMTETNNFNDLELELSNSTSTTTRQLTMGFCTLTTPSKIKIFECLTSKLSI